MGDELSQIQLNHLNATFLFEEHRRPVINYFFPNNELVDLRQEPHLEFSCDNPYLVQPLRQLLPFGHYLTTGQRNALINNATKRQFVLFARSQFLFWYLARTGIGITRTPVTHLAIYYESDQFWFNHIAANRTNIINRLLVEGNPVFFLQRFTLTHTFLQLELGELRLVSPPYTTDSAPADSANFRAAHGLVHIPGSTYQFEWSDNSHPTSPLWTLTRNHSDPQLVNPLQPYFFPPSSPGDPDFAQRVQEPINYHLPLTQEDSDSTSSGFPSRRSTPQPTDWENPPEPGWSAQNPYRSTIFPCPCISEFCTCGFRPDTPPTPPHITLWSPGDKHLPSSN